jgi:type VI secretion system protein ImpE
MGAKELFDAGNLSGAIEQITQDVKSNPRDVKSRIFLFELLCFAGELQRAERQLDAVAQTSGDVKVEMGVQLYRGVLQAETARRGFFTGVNRTPKFFSEPPSYAALHIDAAVKLRENKVEEVEKLLEQSAGERHPVGGHCAGKPFDDFHDGDDLINPFLEVYFQSDYYWLPFEQIKRMDVQAPGTLRDLLWTPVRVELRDRPVGEVFVPAQYFGSHENADDLVKLGRMTDWKSVGDEVLVGVGQRIFFADETEYPLLEIRTVEFAVQ